MSFLIVHRSNEEKLVDINLCCYEFHDATFSSAGLTPLRSKSFCALSGFVRGNYASFCLFVEQPDTSSAKTDQFLGLTYAYMYHRTVFMFLYCYPYAAIMRFVFDNPQLICKQHLYFSGVSVVWVLLAIKCVALLFRKFPLIPTLLCIFI